VSDKYEILVSAELKKRERQSYYGRYFEGLTGYKIELPMKYFPGREFLEWHREVRFREKLASINKKKNFHQMFNLKFYRIYRNISTVYLK
jgi:hypothetical protein